MKNNWKFFTNKDCEYYPCHNVDKRLPFNCKFCYCPLYNKKNCGGNYTILENGVKDCSACIIPHQNWNLVYEKLIH